MSVFCSLACWVCRWASAFAKAFHCWLIDLSKGDSLFSGINPWCRHVHWVWSGWLVQVQSDLKGGVAACDVHSEMTWWIWGHLRFVCVTFDGGPFEKPWLLKRRTRQRGLWMPPKSGPGQRCTRLLLNWHHLKKECSRRWKVVSVLSSTIKRPLSEADLLGWTACSAAVMGSLLMQSNWCVFERSFWWVPARYSSLSTDLELVSRTDLSGLLRPENPFYTAVVWRTFRHQK